MSDRPTVAEFHEAFLRLETEAREQERYHPGTLSPPVLEALTALDTIRGRETAARDAA